MCVIVTVSCNVGRKTLLSQCCPHGLKSPSVPWEGTTLAFFSISLMLHIKIRSWMESHMTAMNREGAHKIETPKPIQPHATTNRSITQLLVQLQPQDPACSPVPAASAESQNLRKSAENDLAKELEQFSRGLAP